jgi:hypothetical protein
MLEGEAAVAAVAAVAAGGAEESDDDEFDDDESDDEESEVESASPAAGGGKASQWLKDDKSAERKREHILQGVAKEERAEWVKLLNFMRPVQWRKWEPMSEEDLDELKQLLTARLKHDEARFAAFARKDPQVVKGSGRKDSQGGKGSGRKDSQGGKGSGGKGIKSGGGFEF